jgi:hypothetical protein
MERIVQISRTLFIAMCESSEARSLLKTVDQEFTYISGIKGTDAIDGHHPCKLGQIYWFCCMLLECQREDPSKPMVVCAGGAGENVTACALLLGSFLILCNGKSASDVSKRFRPIADRFSKYYDSSRHPAADLSVFECWEALHTVSMLGWLNFTEPDVDIDSCIDMQVHCLLKRLICTKKWSENRCNLESNLCSVMTVVSPCVTCLGKATSADAGIPALRQPRQRLSPRPGPIQAALPLARALFAALHFHPAAPACSRKSTRVHGTRAI